MGSPTTIATIFGVLVLSAALLFSLQKIDAPQERFIVRLLYFTLLAVSYLFLASQLAGSNWRQELQIGAFIFIVMFWLWKIFRASFWGILFNQAVLVAHLALGGYLYTATQIPYGDAPFKRLSDNQPQELDPKSFPHHWISGLPVADNIKLPNQALLSDPTLNLEPTAAGPRLHKSLISALSWENLQTMMERDSHIRRILQRLKEKQERELSDLLAQLNNISVNSTQMRRRALQTDSVDRLLKERAISATRHKTMTETWNLLDSEEQAFRRRQAEERFHVLLDLMEDEKIDESHKVDFIRFMVSNFAGDVRLLKPLISLYEDLDHLYPRQKRLNRSFLDLYIARCNVLLEGFSKMGEPALQSLLDYRSRTITEMGYAKARLDRFISIRFGVKVPSLYLVAEPQSVPDFLNRRKYPILEKLAGASFEQDYIRRDLLQTIAKNQPPQAGQPILNYPAEEYLQIKALLSGEGYHDRLDYLVIDSNPVVRANLAWALAEQKSPYMMPIVFELMRDSNPEVRRLAAIAIGNFKIADTQGASDPKFIEIVRMLQNYRSNSDAFSRGWALLSLSNSADQQKVLYVIDLIINDGSGYHSTLGTAAPTWRSEEEQHVIKSLTETLEKTPEELLVKTYALNSLIALNSPESLGILLQYLAHVYETHHTRPTMWRFFLPHLTIPQEAENIEDVIIYLGKHKESGHEYIHNRHLKALNEFLRQFYRDNRSGEYFQLLRFLKIYDEKEYRGYLQENINQIYIMRIMEYAHATYLFWLVFWPVTLLIFLILIYLFLPFLSLSTPRRAGVPNSKANPASDSRQQTTAPAPTIVPVKISRNQ